jgi:RNA polymerase sigma factor (sigma-70 family)
MDRQAEARIIQQAQEGSVSAQEFLLRAHSGLICMIARYYARMAGAMEFEDLQQEGKLGLLKAIRKYDPERGTRLTTMAYPWIRQAIRRAIDRQAEIIRTPTHVGAEGRAPKVVSLDYPVGECQDTLLHEILPAEGDLEDDTIDRLMAMVLPANVAAAFDCLSEYQRVVITLRFGLDGFEPCSHDQIAAELGTSQRHSCRIEQTALRALRDQLNVPEPEAVPRRAPSAVLAITDEERATIRQLAAEGLTGPEIARRVGRSTRRVNEVLQQGRLDV